MQNQPNFSIENLKERIDKFKDELHQSTGLNLEKLNEIEKEITNLREEFENDQYESLPHDNLDTVLRLYDAERSYSNLLQSKLLEIKLEQDYSDSQSNDTKLILEVMKEEFAKLTNTFLSIGNTPSQDESEISRPVDHQSGGESHGSIEGLLSQEHKKMKGQLVKQKDYYEGKIKALDYELDLKNQEVQALKTAIKEEETNQVDKPSTFQDKTEEFDGTLDLQEEYELTKETLENLRYRHQTIERELDKERVQIENYKEELTDLKRILGEKNKEIKTLKTDLEAKELTQAEKEFPEVTIKTIESLEQENQQLKTEYENVVKDLNVQQSKNRELQALVKKLDLELHAHESETTLIKARQELDDLIKSLWKIERNIGIFEHRTTEIDIFERHLEVYSLLLGKLFNTKTHAIILDKLLEKKGSTITKKMIIDGTNIDPFLAIKILRELSDAGVISFNEEGDSIQILV